MDLIGKQARCSAYCRCTEHADDIIAVITHGTAHQIKSFLEIRCTNGAQVSDRFGRNALHIAASCGKLEVVDWLITQKHAELKSRDLESGWTVLHRSLFYGQINIAVLLANCGCNLYKHDIEGLSPLDLVMKDQPSYVEYNASGPTECYTWGANTNFTLGHSNQHSRKHPELVEELVKKGLSIKQIVMCKFHTIFLTHCGKVLTCGHGQGGRLGLEDEHTYLVPHLIEGVAEMKCIQVAAGRDHIVFLFEGGLVYTCGQNDYHQLGLSLGITCHIPKPISLKNLKGKVIVGVAAGRFHTVLFSNDAVYTFGLNAGQLGHPKDDKYQLYPRQVTSLHHKDVKICALATSDAATVCATTKGDIYALHEYQCRKIASKCLNIKKLVVFGGHLDSDSEQSMLQKQGGEDLQVVALTTSGTVFVWKVADKCLKRCLWDVKCQLFVSDVTINKQGIIICTTEGQGFLGFMSKKGHTVRDLKPKVVPSTSPDAFSVAVRTKHAEKEEVELVHLERIPFIHRGVQVASDKSGKNFAFLQSDPKTSLVEIPQVRASVMTKEFAALFKEVNSYNNIHDVILKVGSRQWPAHKYILSTRSEYFRKLFLQEVTEKEDKDPKDSNILMQESSDVVALGHMITAPILDLLLQFIYEDQCDLFKPEFKYVSESTGQGMFEPIRSLEPQDIAIDAKKSAYAVNQELKKAGKSKKKEGRKQKKNQANEGNDDLVLPVKLLQNAAKQFKVSQLVQRLDGVKVQNGQLHFKKSGKKLSYNRNRCSYLSDVILEAEGGTTFRCHKCILVARLEYFNSMLASDWIETSSKTALKLPMPSEALRVILDYLYTDEAAKLRDCHDIEFLCNLLTVADQLLITRLKELCEVAITSLISLKNAAELLEFSSVYQADQLMKTCQQFICLNLPVMIESQALDILSNPVMDELTKSYKEMIPAMSRRIITPYADAPDLSLFDKYPSEDDGNAETSDRNAEALEDFHMIQTQEQAARKAKARRKSRRASTRKTSCSISESVDEKSENEDKMKSDTCEIQKQDGGVTQNDNVQKMDNICSGDAGFGAQDFSDRSKSDLEPGLWGWKSPPQRESLVNPNGLREIMQFQSKTSPASKRTPVKAVTPSGKKSQKQRKREMLLMSQKTDSVSAQDTASEPVVFAWGKEAERVPTKSFRELLIDEEKHAPVSHHVPMATSPPTSSTRGTEILSWGLVRRSKPSLQIDTQVSTDPANSAAPEHINPWLATSPQSPDEDAVKFSDILESEEQQELDLDKSLRKSFSLIQIEDRAVQELLLHYKADGNPDEFIKVERVSKVTATPVWKKEKR
ncbi:inhibitor of Bruton tyrosine kinase-like isoform X2 [Anneissia japonica]|uniref:inhibitor of Bruton tyrosine kinase-like isoform X2 n=1 Tax=Anneissia japonica TaxID=1529436 RepID=UPI0014258E2C|nr:inhibitor of Bruton tyrosine kinase-like isoform X2 [Anneissia japonica]